jgi:hypothetical protein
MLLTIREILASRDVVSVYGQAAGAGFKPAPTNKNLHTCLKSTALPPGGGEAHGSQIGDQEDQEVVRFWKVVAAFLDLATGKD